jgi:hypothetical protein
MRFDHFSSKYRAVAKFALSSVRRRFVRDGRRIASPTRHSALDPLIRTLGVY